MNQANPSDPAHRDGILVDPEVAAALAERRPVVALESTIFSSLGLPAPVNRETFDECIAAIRGQGVVPAVCAVLDGVAHVGVAEPSPIFGLTTKLAERDLPVAIARGASGVTTVSATVALAARAGIGVFATGGIGGVHRATRTRAGETTDDISADLPAIARHPVVTVSAGVKGFLDVARTVEYLETAGVPVLGWRTDEFPAFWCATSGAPVAARVEDGATVAACVGAARALGNPTGMLVVAACPPEFAISAAEIEPVIDAALASAADAGVRGGAVTPFVLERIAAATGERALLANRALAVQNAQIASKVARAIAGASL